MVVDELFHPTKACKLNFIPEAMQDVTAQLTNDIPEEVFRNSEYYDERLMDQLRNDDGFVKVHAGKSTNLHTKILKSGDANMNTIAYVDPHLVACGASSANQLRMKLGLQKQDGLVRSL